LVTHTRKRYELAITSREREKEAGRRKSVLFRSAHLAARLDGAELRDDIVKVVQVLVKVKDCPGESSIPTVPINQLAFTARPRQVETVSIAMLTVDSHPLVHIHILGRSDDRLEAPLDQGGLDERLTEVQRLLFARASSALHLALRWVLGHGFVVRAGRRCRFFGGRRRSFRGSEAAVGVTCSDKSLMSLIALWPWTEISLGV
jgi:hypothetical protein